MKRIISLLCVLMTIPWITAWTDVSESAWYAEAADWCEEEGLMSMADSNTFNAKETVTREELLHEIACVLSWIMCGSKELPPAPDDWGIAVITANDNRGTITFCSWDSTAWRYWNGLMGKEPIHYTLVASEDEVAEFFPDLKAGQNNSCDAQIDFGDKIVTGHLYGTMNSDMENGEAAFLFYPYDHSDYENAGLFEPSSPSALFLAAKPVGSNCRDSVYYLEKLGIANVSLLDTPAPRWYMAELLYHLSQLESVPNEIFRARCSSTPPSDSIYAEWLTPLYQAGIIKGMDDVGTFAPDEVVTRAQLATVLYRIANS